ncbi:Arrestin C-terminal-like domain-containing protein [Caenorhabditis elegans]|uniref:Arrestin C-terminal-like domain-containing protein n=1 Tax=Caenorhabditis elegans TaxID=6239 RepID=I2HAG9_CAEEL|nr:Arrestin C-terminal-like domain-containing protein [Caenorhabditis elegans]CCH63897.1 Arrestin C-terminal-like domain-containing protein [Caenorhabditis elegans]|eukprot:NP_001263667.1 ARRestin Domain protein [Caenorhabditis elegans]
MEITKKLIFVVPNATYIPKDLQQINGAVSKNIGVFFKSGIVSVKTSFPQRVLITGEVIPLTLLIDNKSTCTVREVGVRIFRIARFYAKDQEKMTRQRKIMIRKSINVEPNTEQQELIEFKVHETVQTFESDLIEVKYLMHVDVFTTSAFRGTLNSVFSVIIGASPTMTEEISDCLHF